MTQRVVVADQLVLRAQVQHPPAAAAGGSVCVCWGGGGGAPVKLHREPDTGKQAGRRRIARQQARQQASGQGLAYCHPAGARHAGPRTWRAGHPPCAAPQSCSAQSCGPPRCGGRLTGRPGCWRGPAAGEGWVGGWGGRSRRGRGGQAEHRQWVREKDLSGVIHPSPEL